MKEFDVDHPLHPLNPRQFSGLGKGKHTSPRGLPVYNDIKTLPKGKHGQPRPRAKGGEYQGKHSAGYTGRHR